MATFEGLAASHGNLTQTSGGASVGSRWNIAEREGGDDDGREIIMERRLNYRGSKNGASFNKDVTGNARARMWKSLLSDATDENTKVRVLPLFPR